LPKIRLELLDTGRLHVIHDAGLSDRALDNLNKYVPALKRMVRCDYTRHADGWQIEKDMPERAFLVKNGGLVDSCLFPSAAQALAFVRRVNRGETPHNAMTAAMQS